ncbi:MAG: hypothetical protein A3B62_00445 [Rhodospirillales bacterium RIFCSPLOWO2_01_FULL_65_14]|nr:MAG: hypothetical protein A3B62_00445 [Rhodospirillales bacterium RIFCSPLOWO2_01_FULL_65_14]
MCTVVILRRPGHDWPLLFAANRDEMVARPWQPPARHWPDRPRVVAGMDSLAGGTWLGLSDQGVIAGVLNRPGSLGPAPGMRSRGELPLEALDHASAADAADALSHLEPGSYRTFNLAIADARDAFWISSVESGGDPVLRVTRVPEGLSMITAHDMNDARSDRIRHYRPLFERAPAPEPEAGEWGAWQALLASRESAPGAQHEGAMNIATGHGFGTVSSSLLALPKPGRHNVKPRFLFAPGPPDEVPYAAVPL